jgi:hypothetical protein
VRQPCIEDKTYGRRSEAGVQRAQPFGGGLGVSPVHFPLNEAEQRESGAERSPDQDFSWSCA